MRASVRFREDYECAPVKGSQDANQTRRLPALAAIHHGSSHGQAAASGSLTVNWSERRLLACAFAAAARSWLGRK